MAYRLLTEEGHELDAHIVTGKDDVGSAREVLSV